MPSVAIWADQCGLVKMGYPMYHSSLVHCACFDDERWGIFAFNTDGLVFLSDLCFCPFP